MKTTTSMVDSMKSGSQERLCMSQTRILLRPRARIFAIVAAFITVGVKLMRITSNDRHLISLSRRQYPSLVPTRSVEESDTLASNVTNNRAAKNNTLVKVAWLMSFPNSGTSFTSAMVRHLSQMSTASNYGKEFLDTKGKPVPMFPSERAKPQLGPFWVDPGYDKFEFSRPTTFALTKTHCGGRCPKCRPKKYIENAQTFLNACLSCENGAGIRQRDQYDQKLVRRAVHLVRNPFDNVVSRFHHRLNKYEREYDNVELNPSRSFFRRYCLTHNKLYEQETETLNIIDSDAFELMRDVPCRDDFFKYVQWHNLAFLTTKSLAIPTLIIHYEQYGTRYNETASELMEFLELEPKGNLIDFVKGKEYSTYFTLEERDRVAKAMKILAELPTWEQISDYFGTIKL